ncbi:MAG: prolyl-tRNA synthetase associated domain-containing protein [Sedimentibacter sp.]
MNKINIDKTLYSGKPSDENRLQKEILTYDLLEKLDIPYVRVDHDALNTIEDCVDVDSILGMEICKNLFLCNGSKTEFYLLLLPGTKKFQTKILSKQMGISRLSFAGSEYMEEFLNITPGSVSILGLMNDKQHKVQLLIDREVAESEYFGCHPCINTSSLKMKMSDILNKFLPYTGHKPIIVEV